MLNPSKDLLNWKDVTRAKLQNLIMNDESSRSINPIQNPIKTSGTMGFHEHGPKTFNKGISVNQQQNNVNGLVVPETFRWTKINNGILHTMCNMDLKEDN